MRRVIVKEFEDLADALSNYNGMFVYRVKNFCVKADEVSLLPIKIMVEGELQNLDKCTIIAKKEEYNFMIFPKFDEDMPFLQQGIFEAHPEFKQKIETMKVETTDKNGNIKEVDANYLLVTMPEVDDDRYDLLRNGVKAAYEQCKTQMEAANIKADAVLAELCVGESEENMQLIKQERDKLNEQWYSHRDKIYEAKLQEIEDAHNKWLVEQDELERKRQEDEAAHGDTPATSMRMDRTDIN